MSAALVDVLVIGGGPAGSTFATRMAQMGHSVLLVEKKMFPRRALGESLTPGVVPLLDVTGARAEVERAGFPRAGRVSVTWNEGRQWREDPESAQGLLVDRGVFDQILLDTARRAGVTVLQPATVCESQWLGGEWAVQVASKDGATRSYAARYVADASGRSFVTRGAKRQMGAPTVAFYAYWESGSPAPGPSIEALDDAWLWSVPLPGGLVNTLAFVDPRSHRPASFLSLLRGSALGEQIRNWRPVSPVLGADATPYFDEDCVTNTRIRVGDAALALDPISSSGVQKAIRMALAGAVVVNTILRCPARTDASIAFYRSSLSYDAARHAAWAGDLYKQRSARGSFWLRRSAPVPLSEPVAAASPAPTSSSPVDWDAPYLVSADVEFVDSPCLEGDLVVVRPAVRHPSLDRPISFLAGQPVAWLLEQIQQSRSLRRIPDLWIARVPPSSGVALARWLVEKSILIPAGGA